MQNSQYLNQFNTADKLAEEPWPEDATLYQVSTHSNFQSLPEYM